jgi:peptidoglycan/LPS O-acetylase OafA/YrhL
MTHAKREHQVDALRGIAAMCVAALVYYAVERPLNRHGARLSSLVSEQIHARVAQFHMIKSQERENAYIR